MAFKNLRLLFMILLMAVVFTGVIYLLFKFHLLLGSLATFLLIFAITVFLFKEMIEQKYDLLSSLPKHGQPVTPFQLMVFGKVLWQYPPEGSYIFEIEECIDKEVVLDPSSRSQSSPQNTTSVSLDHGYEMELQLFAGSRLGRKSDRTEEEWEALVGEYLLLGNYEKQEVFCLRHHIGSPRTFRNYIRKYKKKYGLK
jgi:hypothetical protein